MRNPEGTKWLFDVITSLQRLWIPVATFKWVIFKSCYRPAHQRGLQTHFAVV